MKFEELKKLTILFIPRETPNGQTSNCMGLAKILTDKGHRVIVVVSHKGQVEIKKPETPVETNAQDENASTVDGEGELVQGKGDLEIMEFGQEKTRGMSQEVYNQLASLFTFNLFAMRDWISFVRQTYEQFINSLLALSDRNTQLEHLVDKYDPDIFVTDGLLEYDAFNARGRAWVWLFSGNPLRILNDTQLPAPFLGLSSDMSNLNVLEQFQGSVVKTITRNLYRLFRVSKYALNLGLIVNQKPFKLITNGSPYFNIYGYPTELDYDTDLKLTFYRVDTFWPKKQFLKESLKISSEKMPKANNEGKKTILILMGPYHVGNAKFMKTLLSNLSNCAHNLLISKESLPKEYEVSPNVINYDPSLTQNQLVEISDLVITDGTDCRVMTAFSLGKPIIAIPFWLEQLDNAQRLHETGYGIRLSPWTYTEAEILGAIEMLLNNKELNDKLSAASTRIIKEDRLDKAAELIENIGLDKDFYKD